LDTCRTPGPAVVTTASSAASDGAGRSPGPGIVGCGVGAADTSTGATVGSPQADGSTRTGPSPQTPGIPGIAPATPNPAVLSASPAAATYPARRVDCLRLLDRSTRSRSRPELPAASMAV